MFTTIVESESYIPLKVGIQSIDFDDYNKLYEYFKSLGIAFNSFTNGIMDLNGCYSQVFRDIIKPLYDCFNDIIINCNNNNKEMGYIISTYIKWIYLRGSVIEIIEFMTTLLMTNGKHKITMEFNKDEKDAKDIDEKDDHELGMMESYEIIGLFDKMYKNILKTENENDIELFKPFALEITCECMNGLMGLITKFVHLMNKSESVIALNDEILNDYCQNQMVKLLELLNKICEKLVWILLNCSDNKIPKELKINKVLLANMDRFNQLMMNYGNQEMEILLNGLSK